MAMLRAGLGTRASSSGAARINLHWSQNNFMGASNMFEPALAMLLSALDMHLSCEHARRYSRILPEFPVYSQRECRRVSKEDWTFSATCHHLKYTSSIKSEWNLHMLKTESNYHNYTLAAESGKKAMQEVLLNWYKQISKVHNIHLSLKFNNDACAKINSMIIPCCEDLIEPKSDHSHKVVEIKIRAWKYLLDENLNVLWCKQVDEPSCSTPMKRPNDIPSIESVEELRIPASETY
ncbi:unnamed protein product [Brassica oleracea]